MGLVLVDGPIQFDLQDELRLNDMLVGWLFNEDPCSVSQKVLHLSVSRVAPFDVMGRCHGFGVAGWRVELVGDQV